jgi:hypothetical protein
LELCTLHPCVAFLDLNPVAFGTNTRILQHQVFKWSDRGCWLPQEQEFLFENAC